MAATIRTVEYYYAVVEDRPGQAAELLKLLAAAGVDLLAFSVVPTGQTHTQLMLFPAESGKLVATARRANLSLEGPQSAFLVQGDNALGGLVELHQRLADANINIYASTGVTDTHGGFGYLMYVRPDEFARAASVCGVTRSPSDLPGAPL